MRGGRCSTASWTGFPLERALFAMAGTMTLLSAILTVTVSPWFALLAAFVAVNQWLYAAVGGCGASMLLSRFAGLRSGFEEPGAEAGPTTGTDR